ncbi:MAG: glycyl-radical enzyme activating protein [Tenuifilaceae bacterium]
MSEKAIVFDIQRASLHDGPGIRTTIFLKGCPLNCLWCHNPESGDANCQLFFYFDKCTQCGDCVKVCDSIVHYFTDGRHAIDYNKCRFCGKCIEACTFNALKIVGKEMDIDEVMPEIMADFDFYKKSEGGMTLSGGEPLFQFSFSMALLKRCREMGVNTCVETSGYISEVAFQQILPYIDVLLFDYKVTGDDDYKKYTGVSNALIIKNLDIAYNYGIPIVLRCPIIPGINDTDLHLMGICEMDKKYPNLKSIEILPYHTLGNSKRISTGISKTLTHLKTVPPEISEKWIEQLRKSGCNKAKIA